MPIAQPCLHMLVASAEDYSSHTSKTLSRVWLHIIFNSVQSSTETVFVVYVSLITTRPKNMTPHNNNNNINKNWQPQSHLVVQLAGQGKGFAGWFASQVSRAPNTHVHSGPLVLWSGGSVTAEQASLSVCLSKRLPKNEEELRPSH